jgi:predicted nucleic acid-binding protein
MIVDTNFLIDLYHEHQAGRPANAVGFRNSHRREKLRTTVVSLAEFAAGFNRLAEARAYLDAFRVYRLFPEAAFEAATVDRELMMVGNRLGEADNLIAGIARYYGETLVSNDAAFRRVPHLRVLAY